MMGKVLAHFSLPRWNTLAPGTMRQMMGKSSDLYLADYWLLTLHWLVWSRQLPYPIQARWLRGQSIHDPTFDFISELPTNLAAASLDALIVFREAALSHGAETAKAIAEPPVLHEGHWQLPGQPADDLAAPKPAGETALRAEVAVRSIAVDGKEDSSQPKLNDQTFTVCSGGRAYRFTARNKQLFALLDRIRRRPGHRVLFNDLRAVGDVWDGSQVEDSTIGGAIAPAEAAQGAGNDKPRPAHHHRKLPGTPVRHFANRRCSQRY